MIELLVALACYLTFYALSPGVGTVMQAAAVLLMFGAAAYAVLLGRVKAIPTSATELVMYVLGVAYIVLAMLREDDAMDAVPIAIVFMSTIVFVSIISRAISLERLLDVGAVVAVLCVATAFAFDYRKALTALVPSSGGLARFMPLGTTPALVGYIFGAASILMARRVLVSHDIKERVVMGGSAFLACLFVLAASARSSLVALTAAAFVAVTFEFGVVRILRSKWVRIAGVSMTIVGLVFTQKIAAYLTRMLELQSSYRGMGSGASGRTELWQRGITTLFENPTTFAFGDGFRSSNTNLIGFSTESSYITILLDSGVFLGTAVILVFLYSPFKALRLTPPQNRHSSSLILLASFLTFLLVESFFSRYLLAIGNPASLMALMVLFSVAMRERSAKVVEAPFLEAGVLGNESK